MVAPRNETSEISILTREEKISYHQEIMYYVFYFINPLVTRFLTIFRRFPTIFRRFPKDFQNVVWWSYECLEHSDRFRKIPKIVEENPTIFRF